MSEKMGFYRVDQSPGGKRSIGVEGDIIEKLTPYYSREGETIYGIIIDYSYVKDSGEFFFWLYNERTREEEMYFFGVNSYDDTAHLSMTSPHRITLESDIPWPSTKRYHTKKKMEFFRKDGYDLQQKGYRLPKELTPRNALRVALPIVLRAKKSGRI